MMYFIASNTESDGDGTPIICPYCWVKLCVEWEGVWLSFFRYGGRAFGLSGSVRWGWEVDGIFYVWKMGFLRLL